MENKKIKIEIRKETFSTGWVNFWIYKDGLAYCLEYSEEQAIKKFNELVEKTKNKSTETIIKSIEI
jgi:hypothetical protein